MSCSWQKIWRYPVKSMGGERLAHAKVGPMGIEATGCARRG